MNKKIVSKINETNKTAQDSTTVVIFRLVPYDVHQA